MTTGGPHVQSRFQLKTFFETSNLHSSSFCWPLLLEEKPEECALMLAKEFFSSPEIPILQKLRKKYFFSFALKNISQVYEEKRLDVILSHCLFKTVINTPAAELPKLFEKTEKSICNKTLSKYNELPEDFLSKAFSYGRHHWIKTWSFHFVPKFIQVTAFLGAYILAYWLWQKNSPMPLAKALKGWFLFFKEFLQ